MRLYGLIAAIYVAMIMSPAAQAGEARSRLAEGHWVEIAVDSTGVHQLSYDELRQLGFNRPEKVNVYGYSQATSLADGPGAAVPDDIPQQLTLHAAGKLYFYGETASRVTLLPDSTVTRVISPYSVESHYFLSDIDGADDMASKLYGVSAPDGDEVSGHTSLIYIEPEVINPYGYGTGWYDRSVTNDSTAVYPVYLEGFDRSWSPWLTVRTIAIDAGTPQLSVSISNTMTTRTVAKSVVPVVTVASIRAPRTMPSRTSVSVSTTGRTGFVSPDWLSIIYPRENVLAGRPQMTMLYNTSTAGLPVRVDNGTEVWDVTDPDRVRRMSVDDGVFAFDADMAQSWRRFVVFDLIHHDILSPRIVGEVGNQDLHAMDVPEMLVVAAHDLVDESRRFVTLHSDLDVAVVDADEVWREFGSGIKSPIAVRRMVNMLRGRGGDRLRYLLLVGNISQDNRGLIRGDGPIPTYECDVDAYMHDETQSYWSIGYYSISDADFNPVAPYFCRPTVATGAIPARSAGQLSQYIDKLMSVSGDPRRSHHDVVLMNDYGDNALYTKQIELHSDTLLKRLDSPVIHKVYSDMYMPDVHDNVLARRALSDALDRYPGYLLYIGHAEYNFMTSSPHWLQINHVPSMKTPPVPVMLLSTCRTTACDVHDTSIAAELLFSPQSGALSVIGSCRFSLSNHNQTFASHFTDGWCRTAGTKARVGDLWLKAFCGSIESYAGNIPGSLNTHKYILLGDPALLLPSVNATVEATVAVDVLAPLSGTIVSGTTDISDGTVEITAYADHAESYLLGRVDADFRGYPIDNNDRKLWRGTATVSGGRFELPVYMPRAALDDCAEVPMHMVVRCWNDDASLSARTVISDLVLTAGGGGGTGALVPVDILSVDIAEADGSMVTPAYITVDAAVDGGTAGLASLDHTLAAPLSLSLDGRLMQNLDVTAGGDGVTRVRLSAGPLADGRHTLVLTATGNDGVTDSASVEFTVIDRSLDVTLTADAAVAHDEVTLTVGSEEPLDECRMVVTDSRGDTVLSRLTGEGDTVWNLTGDDGRRLSPGHYSIRLLAKSGRKHTATPPLMLTILNPVDTAVR